MPCSHLRSRLGPTISCSLTGSLDALLEGVSEMRCRSRDGRTQCLCSRLSSEAVIRCGLDILQAGFLAGVCELSNAAGCALYGGAGGCVPVWSP
jgi:hypothetical protein